MKQYKLTFKYKNDIIIEVCRTLQQVETILFAYAKQQKILINFEIFE